MTDSRLPSATASPALSGVAREMIAYYTKRGGCGNCGGMPHSTTCFVGRFEQALKEESANAAGVTPQEDRIVSGQASDISDPRVQHPTMPVELNIGGVTPQED